MSAHLTILPRVLREGYGPGAWHGPDLKAATDDVSPDAAFWRPSPERHNVAEIALHHAYYVHSVQTRLGAGTKPFPLAGDDWFALDAGGPLDWPAIRSIVADEYGRLTTLVDAVAEGRHRPSLTDAECLELVLGITCHAAYHAGQMQLIRRLRG